MTENCLFLVFQLLTPKVFDWTMLSIISWHHTSFLVNLMVSSLSWPIPTWSPDMVSTVLPHGGHWCPLYPIMENIYNKQELIFKSIVPSSSMDPCNWTEMTRRIVFLKHAFKNHPVDDCKIFVWNIFKLFIKMCHIHPFSSDIERTP